MLPDGTQQRSVRVALVMHQVSQHLKHAREFSVTRCLPTLITSSFDNFAASARVLARVRSAAVAGIHLEGPYISPEDGFRGAHHLAHVKPASIEDFKRRQEAAEGRIALVTLAPEVDGAVPLIEYLVNTGVRVAAGHTAATPQQLADAIAAGVTLATHLGNGCAHMLPRHPNTIWELLAADAVFATFIVDGHHLPPATVKAMIRAKGVERSVLVTDAVAAAGCAPGMHTIGGVQSELSADGRVSLPGTPYLAGSALRMDRAIANAVRFTGLPIDVVIPMASTIPAACVGLTTSGTVHADWDAETAELTVLRVTD